MIIIFNAQKMFIAKNFYIAIVIPAVRDTDPPASNPNQK